MRDEAWPEAAKSFQQAIDIDRDYEGAYYGLGLASMRLKKYSDAIEAYLKCRDSYRAQAGKQFTQPPGCAAVSAGSADGDRRQSSGCTQPDHRPHHPGSHSSAQIRSDRHPGLHLARQQRHRRELGTGVRLWPSAAPTSAPNSGPMRSANTRPRLPSTPSRAMPSTTSPSSTCRPDATRRPTTRSGWRRRPGSKCTRNSSRTSRPS